MKKWHCRCKKCGARRKLTYRPEEYYRVPPCRSCGAKDYRIDKWMMKRDTRKDRCDCNGYVYLTGRVFPHRIGSPYCWYRKDGTQRFPGDPDFKDAYLERYPDEITT